MSKIKWINLSFCTTASIAIPTMLIASCNNGEDNGNNIDGVMDPDSMVLYLDKPYNPNNPTYHSFGPKYNSKIYDFKSTSVPASEIQFSDTSVVTMDGTSWGILIYTDDHVINGSVWLHKPGECILTFHMKEVGTLKDISTTVKITVAQQQ